MQATFALLSCVTPTVHPTDADSTGCIFSILFFVSSDSQ